MISLGQVFKQLLLQQVDTLLPELVVQKIMMEALGQIVQQNQLQFLQEQWLELKLHHFMLQETVHQVEEEQRPQKNMMDLIGHQEEMLILQDNK